MTIGSLWCELLLSAPPGFDFSNSASRYLELAELCEYYEKPTLLLLLERAKMKGMNVLNGISRYDRSETKADPTEFILHDLARARELLQARSSKNIYTHCLVDLIRYCQRYPIPFPRWVLDEGAPDLLPALEDLIRILSHEENMARSHRARAEQGFTSRSEATNDGRVMHLCDNIESLLAFAHDESNEIQTTPQCSECHVYLYGPESLRLHRRRLHNARLPPRTRPETRTQRRDTRA